MLHSTIGKLSINPTRLLQSCSENDCCGWCVEFNVKSPILCSFPWSYTINVVILVENRHLSLYIDGFCMRIMLFQKSMPKVTEDRWNLELSTSFGVSSSFFNLIIFQTFVTNADLITNLRQFTYRLACSWRASCPPSWPWSWVPTGDWPSVAPESSAPAETWRNINQLYCQENEPSSVKFTPLSRVLNALSVTAEMLENAETSLKSHSMLLCRGTNVKNI